ncbi:glycerol-3-phosphate dehydrogenase [Cylindrospermopsis raciborskii S07]|uniref:Glycerol-3-phosphate dehydrogenase [NAD(P)+] n=2 Tax=Cylindrospermopsis raciborskii TaxID=77022 RepID=A0A853MEF4_9CYAN|nr:NAD(P)H-dependent glycerol-3-phosphate dehydrogenase [Cylindrospermopsis raciborskii]EFA70012.1 NAD-dependent glycerol-3-phosphate dehydrogenase-like protein [Cylindrospermopsis raciborskii CS-505]OBU77273.1 glycerol-3-phosphate dehydrogenase [Cylindrospermopsis raciborskii CS-505]PNJ90749.1 glycerol-3-phosphate dehydrogenase [Cylindrospermopsis raciborskii C07]PNJ94156.1 glycerol-3-phosphate dehydrogenase [Cylindrospermopsis raciborskii C03]PNJ96025.1 glycerol-3-phosphate dehydrogenase [Cy
MLVNEKKFKSILILGAGAWGTTLAKLARVNGNQVTVWSRHGSQHLGDLINNVDMVLSAVSMKGVREVASLVKSFPVSPHTIFVTATKGLDPETTCTPSQIWQTEFPNHSIVVLSGPNLSQEIAQELPAATVVASKNNMAAQVVQQVFSSGRFRVYTNPDPVGVELGGTLKNVMAIAAGICDGLNLGTNAKAALVTRGLAEIIRIGAIFGAKTETFYGLSGLGDLLATCNSPLSRNYQVGYQLARGKTLAEILANLPGTAEGVNTCYVLMHLSLEQSIPMPITQQVYRLLESLITPQQALEELMLRGMKSEYHE